MVAFTQTATVLLVEDQVQLRRLTSRILERDGYHVLSAENGATALLTLEEHQNEVNILLSDVIMPGIDGIQLARQVRSRFPAVKIILMSGYGSDELSQSQSSPYVDELLLKPFTPATLVQAIRKAT